MSDSIFTKIINREIPANIEYEDDQLIVIHDINPQAPTHLLIVPKKVIPTINHADASDRELLGEMILRAQAVAAKLGFAEDGYRLVFNCNLHGGQEVYHIHLHLLGERQMKWPPG